jgi:hypothetical protein
MSSTLRYDYDLPWRGVALAFAINTGISLIAAHCAKSIGGFFSIGPIFLSVAFAFLALWVIVRRLIFSRVLELTDDAILFPGGFSGKRINRLAYADIMRISNLIARPGLRLHTVKGYFEIMSVRFTNIESYRAARTCVCSKTSILLPEDKRGTEYPGWVPGPVLKWNEPEDYIRYRTHLAVSKPLWLRLAKAVRFFACVFGFFFIPWFVLNFIFGFGEPVAGFFAVLIPASLFFTWIHWYNATHPARVTHVNVFPDGFSLLSGLQTANFSFSDFSGWSVVEREFEGHILHILLLQRPKYVLGIVFPDTNTRDQFIQMLNEKKVPQLNSLKPSWELKP